MDAEFKRGALLTPHLFPRTYDLSLRKTFVETSHRCPGKLKPSPWFRGCANFPGLHFDFII